MLDTSQCQKPIRRMNFPGIRSSKFRHVYGLPSKKDKCYENLRITRNAHDGNYCAVNPKFLAVVVEVGGGGSFVVLPLTRTGRVEHSVWKVTGHEGPVLDVRWNPFNDNIVASASEDCRVRTWQVPDGGLTSDLRLCLVEMTGHRRRVGLIDWHPTAENILASAGYDHLLIIWNAARGLALSVIQCHQDTIFSMSFNRDGSLLATTCKDKTLRVIEPRAGQVVREGPSHQGTKPAKVTFLGATGKLFTTGFSKHSDRQIAVWSEKDLSQPLKLENIDCSSGILNPVYDHDTNMVYVYGKGDGNVRYYEVLTDSPWASYLSQVISGEPQKGFGVMPKRGVDVSACELFRFYKLHATKDVVEPISMIVPRKSSVFQEDIFPDTSAPQPSLSGEEWFQGRNAYPVLMSMKPEHQMKTSYRRTLPAIVDTREERERNSPKISNKNNDRKFFFLSKETNPDYRQVCADSRVDNNLNISEKLQTQHKHSPLKTEKDIKISLNLGTKFQQNCIQSEIVDNNYSNSIYGERERDGSVRSDKDLSVSSSSEIGLKKVVHEQKKLIRNLREQLEGKDKQIKVLENRVELLLRNIPKTNLDLSFELNEQSFA